MDFKSIRLKYTDKLNESIGVYNLNELLEKENVVNAVGEPLFVHGINGQMAVLQNELGEYVVFNNESIGQICKNPNDKILIGLAPIPKDGSIYVLPTHEVSISLNELFSITPTNMKLNDFIVIKNDRTCKNFNELMNFVHKEISLNDKVRLASKEQNLNENQKIEVEKMER